MFEVIVVAEEGLFWMRDRCTFDARHVGAEHVESVDEEELVQDGGVGLYWWIVVIVVLSLFVFISFLGEGLYHGCQMKFNSS